MVSSLLVSTFAVLLAAPVVTAPPAAPPPPSATPRLTTPPPAAAPIAGKPAAVTTVPGKPVAPPAAVTTTAGRPPAAVTTAAPAGKPAASSSAAIATVAAKPGTPTPARAATPPPKPVPAPLDWRARVAIALKTLQTEAPDRLAQLDKLQPTRTGRDDELAFAPAALHDPRAAAVLLRRLLQGEDPVAVRCALVDALPQTGGDWQEGAAALIGIDASPAVRKRLVESMRYADAPHSVHGLRLGFKDEDPEVNIAAARTAGFSRQGPDLVTELYSSTFDTDWDLRAAAVQSLGMLRLPQSREVLLKALYDEEREVRLQGLLALEQLDPEGVLWLPEIDLLARDRKSHRIARKADLMLQKRRAAEKAGKAAKLSAAASASKPATAPAPAPTPLASPAPRATGTH